MSSVRSRRAAVQAPPMQVTMQQQVVSRLASGRIRALALPPKRFVRLRPGDLLWVGEAFKIEEGQPRLGELLVRYSGSVRPVPVAWPRALARPHGGPRLGPGMPVECSRWTLRVLAAEMRHLRGLTDAEAVECGAEAVEGGWGPPGADESVFRPFSASWDAVGYIFDADHGFGAAEELSDVMFIRFEALARNVGHFVPGMSSGGARA